MHAAFKEMGPVVNELTDTYKSKEISFDDPEKQDGKDFQDGFFIRRSFKIGQEDFL